MPSKNTAQTVSNTHSDSKAKEVLGRNMQNKADYLKIGSVRSLRRDQMLPMAPARILHPGTIAEDSACIA